MYYYYKPRVQIKDGAAMVEYKSLTQLALSNPVTEQPEDARLLAAVEEHLPARNITSALG